MATKIKTDAKIIRVIDGDTIEVKVKVRMAAIDAPETKGIEKEAGFKTKQWLINRLKAGQDVQLVITAGDVYRRLLADVFDGSVNIGEEMLKEHLVEHYTPEHHNNGVMDE